MSGCKNTRQNLGAVKILRKKHLIRLQIDSRHKLEALAKFEDKSTTWEEDAIIKFFGWFESDDKIYLAMEFFELGDLSLYITSRDILEAET